MIARIGSLALGVLLVACASRSTPDEPAYAVVSERAEACRTLVNEVEAVDLGSADEATLEELMNRALDTAPGCRDAFLADNLAPGEREMARHEGRQLDLYALLLEATLSERFDGYAGYCAIVADTFQLLLNNVAELENTVRTAELSEREAIALRDLLDLDLHAMDLLVVASENHCQ